MCVRLNSFLPSAVANAPRPHLLATVVSYPHREQTIAYAPVIKDVRWSPDGTQLVYKAESLQGRFQLCFARINGSHRAILSSRNQDVDQFDIVGDTIVYTASVGDDQAERSTLINPDARAVTGSLLYQILFPTELAQNAPQTFKLFTLRFTHGAWKAKRVPHFSMRARSLLSDLTPFCLSPDRHKLITMSPVRSIPSSWEQLRPAPGP
jgi:hypothetical protein